MNQKKIIMDWRIKIFRHNWSDTHTRIITTLIKRLFIHFRLVSAVCISSLSRPAIVLFIMASGYLILRKQQPLSKIPERVKRIVLPFIFWLIIYAVIKFFIKPDLNPNWNMLDLTVFIAEGFLNPTDIAIQFWYVYMILGLYLLSPILSRWIQNAPINEIEYFILI